jgi:hypothetical protein
MQDEAHRLSDAVGIFKLATDGAAAPARTPALAARAKPAARPRAPAKRLATPAQADQWESLEA